MKLSVLENQVQEKPFLLIGKPDITEREEAAVLEVLRSGWLGNGPVTKNLENAFARFVEVHSTFYALATSSCTVGLYLTLKAWGVGQGDEVITTPLTFAATVNAILQTGAKPVFVDVDESGCIDPQNLMRGMSKHTKVILPVHLTGTPCDMASICDFARYAKVKVLEDAAHAFGGYYNAFPLGTWGDAAVFSFYPTKNIASGDGGMVVSPDSVLIEKVRVLASQGLTADAWMRYSSGPVKEYEVVDVGFKGLMTDLHSAVALAQIERWQELREKRFEIWTVYEEAFGKKQPGHSQHLYSIRVKNRRRFREELYHEGVGTGVHYEALHLQPAYEFLKYKEGRFPVAEMIGRETVSLPIGPTMTKKDAHRVVRVVRSAMS